MDKTIILDISKQESVSTAPIILRQGEDNSVTLQIYLTEEGAACDLSGLDVRFLARCPDGHVVINDCEKQAANLVTLTLPSSLTAVPGEIVLSYIGLYRGDEWIATTESIGFVILHGVDITAEQAEPYINEFLKAKVQLDAILAEATQQKNEQQSVWQQQTDLQQETWQQQTGTQQSTWQQQTETQQTDWQQQTETQQTNWQTQMDGQASSFDATQSNRQTAFEDAEDARQQTFEQAEASRATAETGRVEAESKRETEFAQMLSSMHSLETRMLVAGEYDDTGKPTIAGEPDIIYLVPKEGTTGDACMEWMFVNGAFELIGSTEIKIESIATDSIDAVVAGNAPAGTPLLNLSGLSYYHAKIAKGFSEPVLNTEIDALWNG